MKTLLLRFLLGRGVGKLQETLSKSVRHGVTALGGALVAKGLTSADDVEALSGAAVIVASVALSIGRALLGEYIGKKTDGKINPQAPLLLIALYVGLIAFGFAASPASALEKTFTWIAPTQYTDGSPLPTAQIAGYTLTCGSLVVPIVGPVTSYKRDFGPGGYSCTLQTRATTTPTPSVPVGPVVFTVPQPDPNAPTGFSVD